MYPQQELIRLAVYKAALRRDIALRRAQCTTAASRVAAPLEWVDRALAFWHRLSPLTKFAALPLGFFAKKIVTGRLGFFGRLLKWAPMIFTAARGVSAAVAASKATRTSRSRSREE